MVANGQIDQAIGQMIDFHQAGVDIGIVKPITSTSREGFAKSGRHFKDGTIIQTVSDGRIKVTTPGGQSYLAGEPGYAEAVAAGAAAGEVYAGAIADAQNRSRANFAGVTAGNTAQGTADVNLVMDPVIEREKAQALAEEGRGQTAISLGVDSAPSLPIFKRGLDLLRTVKTGGIDSARFKAESWLCAV